MITRRSGQSGVALLAALALTMAVVMIMANIFYRHQINVAQTALSLHQDQASLLALGGESWAQQLLEEDKTNNQHDGFDDLWAQAIPAMPVDGGLLNGCISDLQGQFNLNNFATVVSLSTTPSVNKATLRTVWNYLLNLQEIPQFPGRVENIIDWVDDNQRPINSYGTEYEDYAGLMPPRIVADVPMVEASELASVMGYEIFEVQKLMPWITALPVTTISNKIPAATTININTASDELLLALGGDYDLQFRDSVVAGRPFKKIEDFHKQLDDDLGLAPSAVTRWPKALVDIKSEYFQLYIEVILGEARIEVKSIIYRPYSGNLAIISRDLTAVPVSVEKNKSSELFEKLISSVGIGSDDDAEDIIDDQQVQPACLMIGA